MQNGAVLQFFVKEINMEEIFNYLKNSLRISIVDVTEDYGYEQSSKMIKVQLLLKNPLTNEEELISESTETI